MARATGMSPIETVAGIIEKAFAALHETGCAGAAEALRGLDAHADLLDQPRYASHKKHFDSLRESLGQDDFLSARRNLGRVRDTLAPSSNDTPFS